MKFYLLFAIFVVNSCQSFAIDPKSKYECPGTEPLIVCPYSSALDCAGYCLSKTPEVDPLVCPGTNPPISCGSRTGLSCLTYCLRYTR